MRWTVIRDRTRVQELRHVIVEGIRSIRRETDKKVRKLRITPTSWECELVYLYAVGSTMSLVAGERSDKAEGKGKRAIQRKRDQELGMYDTR